MPCLSSALPGGEARGALLDDEEGGAFRRVGEHGEEVGVAAVGDELLAAVDGVADDGAVVAGDRRGRGLEALEVAAGLRLGDPVGHDGAFFGQLAEPLLFLLVGGAHQDGVGAQVDGQEGRRHAQADLGHLFGDRRDVAGAAAHAAELFGDEEQLQADLGAEQFADGFFREGLVRVPLPQFLRRQHALTYLREQIEHHFTFFDG